MAFGLVAGLASFALQGASALAAHGAQKDAARKNKASAFAAFRLNSADLAARGLQAQEAALLDILAIGQEGQAAASTAAASAAENGVAGGSVTALLESYRADTGRALDVVDRNLDITLDELDRRKTAAGMEYQDRLAAVPSPSTGALGLNLLGAAAQSGPQIAPYFRSGGPGIQPMQLLGPAKPAASLKLTRTY
jgi:hypothetical protein